MPPAHDRAEVGEINVDQPGAREQSPDAAHTLGEQLVRVGERVREARVLVNELEHPLVREADHAVGGSLQLFEANPRLLLPARALALERQGDKRQHECAGLARNPRDHRAGPGAGAAAQARGDKDHVGVLAQLPDLLRIRFGRGATQFRIAARAQAARELRAELEALHPLQLRERLRVGVEHGKAHVVESGEPDLARSVAAGATNTKNFDDEFPADFRIALGVVCVRIHVQISGGEKSARRRCRLQGSYNHPARLPGRAQVGPLLFHDHWQAAGFCFHIRSPFFTGTRTTRPPLVARD